MKESKSHKQMNFSIQMYRGIPIRLIDRNYSGYNAMRFTLNGTNQNVWIPKKHLSEDGTILPNQNLDYVFKQHSHQLNLSGITQPILGIKRSVEWDPYLSRRTRCADGY